MVTLSFLLPEPAALLVEKEAKIRDGVVVVLVHSIFPPHLVQFVPGLNSYNRDP